LSLLSDLVVLIGHDKPNVVEQYLDLSALVRTARASPSGLMAAALCHFTIFTGRRP
jgi:hypothetical protein